MTIDYTPVGGLSRLARRSGKVAGQWKQEDLNLAREQLKQHDRDVATRNAQFEKELVFRERGQQIQQEQFGETTAYSERVRAEELAQQEFLNKNIEEAQAWKEETPARNLLEAKKKQKLLNEQMEYEYTEEQRQLKDKLRAAIAEVWAGVPDKYTPEDAMVLEERLLAKDRNVLPIKMRKEPSANEIFNNTLIIPEDGSKPTMFMGPKGPELLPSVKEENANLKNWEKVKQDLIESKAKLATELSKVLGEDKEPVYSDEQIKEKVNAFFNMFSGEGTVQMKTQAEYDAEMKSNAIRITPENSLKISLALQSGLINDEDIAAINQVLMQDPSKISQVLAMIENRKIRKQWQANF